MKLYRLLIAFCCVLTAAVVLLTAVSLSGADVFGSVVSVILCSAMAAACLVCVCFAGATGKPVYKAGYYVLHIAVVVLLAGFVIYHAAGSKATVVMPVGDRCYSRVLTENDDGEEEYAELGFSMGVEATKTEYYNDGSPKYYEASVVFADTVTLKTETEKLTVNNPLRKNGYKIYLMSLGEQGGNEYVVLLLKRNPAEYTIIFGIVALISGCVMMCFSGRRRGDKNV